MLFGLALPAWLLSLLANKWVRYAALIVAAFIGYEFWKARQRAAGAERERAKYRARSDQIREGMIRAPQFNEEGTANELDQGRY